MMSKKVLLIDGNSFLFRAFYATAYKTKMKMLTNINSIPINAVYIFINMLNKVIKSNDYYSIVVIFDKNKKNFRHDLLKCYKNNRNKMPRELIVQFSIIKEFLDSYNIDYIEKDNYEADDIIGCLAKLAEKNNYYVDILSSDKDFFQLITEKINVLIMKKGISRIEVYDKNRIYSEWGIIPEQVTDLKGLMGDSSDNFKGVFGIGKKTAIKLIKKFYSIEGIYNNIDEVTGLLKKRLLLSKSDAFICKNVATILCDISIFKDFIFNRHVMNVNKLIDFYSKYDMDSYLTKLLYDNGHRKSKNNVGYNFINNLNTSTSMNVKILKKWDMVYNCKINTVYLEFYDENYHISTPIGFGIINETGIYYYDFSLAKGDKSFLAFLKNSDYEKWTYDAKRMIVNLYNNNIFIHNITYDMMLAGYVYNSNTKTSIDTYIKLFSGEKILPDKLFYGKGIKKEIPTNIIKLSNFICEKANYINNLHDRIIGILKDNNQYDLYENIELPTAFALAKMEINGIKIDKFELERQCIKINKIVSDLNTEINLIANKVINPNSSKQISELLYSDLKLPNYSKGSTSKEVLYNIKDKHKIVIKILNYRKYQKLYSTYLKGIKKYIFPDGKIHTIYKQTLTVTGRLSSVEPNIQNISIRDDVQREVRKIFSVSNENNVLLSADYSQIELRILAHMSKDSALISAFNNNEDIHTSTAMRIFNLNKDEITFNVRRGAKTVNFGIIYGISEFGLAQELNISVLNARNIIEYYYHKFPQIKSFIVEQINFCKKYGYIKTLFNRKRYVPEINNLNYMQRKFGERIAINMPIQGSAADIIKIALKNIYQEFSRLNLKSKIIAQIHDELIFEVVFEELGKVKSIVKEMMESSVKLDVSLVVNISVGKTFYDLL